MGRMIVNKFLTQLGILKNDFSHEDICYELDYFGNPGTTSKIVFDHKNNCYILYAYDANGKQKKFGLPICRKKFEKLMDVWFQDVLGYLKANEAKVNTYQSTRLNNKVDLKALYMDIVVSAVIVIIGLILTCISFQIALFNWPTIVSFLICSLSSVYMCVKLLEKYKYDQDVKKYKFISGYKSLQMSLNEYNLSKAHNLNPTKYQELNREVSLGNNIKKLKVRKQEYNN